MANKVQPYHTITPEQDEPSHRNVYHDYSDCPDGSRIKPENKRSGTGDRQRCDACTDLD